jgi:phytoene dehydrogenase-like protein
VRSGEIDRLPERRGDAIVIGSGPNGLAGAIALAEAGLEVTVFEGAELPGGGCRSEALTLTDFVHDSCSTVHALALASPFFSRQPLAEHGLQLVHPEAPLAHPLDDGSAVIVERSVEQTAAGLGADATTYRALMRPLVDGADGLMRELLAPLRPPRQPLLLARFGLRGMRSAVGLARSRFEARRARALLGGLSAHSMLSLWAPASAAFGLVLGVSAHAYGWPVARGGSQLLTEALLGRLRSLGGELETGHWVESLDELDGVRPVLADVGPSGLRALAGPQLSGSYARRLARFRYGPGVFKLDWALDGPIPWRAEEVGRAGTVHLGGTLEELAASEHAASSGRASDRPFVLLVQPTLFDPTRAPQGKQVAWAYCHVPNGSNRDMTAAIESQVERFAPGFRDLVLERSAVGPAEVEARNPNFVGGDINGGVQDLRQLFTRPVPSLNPYSTPLDGVYLCSSSTPPGGGVHGMCGYWAARAALRHRGDA